MAPFPTRRIVSATDSTDSLESYPPSPILSHSNLNDLTHSTSTSISNSKRKARTLPKLRSTDPAILYGQVILPSAGILSGIGRSYKSQEVVKSCLMDNHINNHTFINERGFHNHISHHVLAAYSLGAGPTLLKDLYDLENFDVRPMPALQPIEITEENWTDYLGDERLYPNFLVFFNTLISTPPVAPSSYVGRASSVVPVLEKYLFGGEGEMLIRSISGAIHPLIHIGHGIEFNLDALVVEGLAQCCVHEAKVSALFSGPWPPTQRSPTSFQSTLTHTLSAFKLGYKPLGVQPIASPSDSFAATAASLPRTKSERDKRTREGLSGFTIIERIMNDPELAAGEANNINDSSLLESALSNKGERIKTWCEEWKFRGEKSVEYEDDNERGSSSNGSSSKARVPSWEEIVEKTEELIWMATVLYAATTRPGYENVKLDFFMMHALTSALFLPSILEQISPHLRPYLLHSHFRIMISYWVSRGTPKVHLRETLLASTPYPTPPNSRQPTLGAVAQALASRPQSTPTASIPDDATTPNADSNGKLRLAVLGMEPVDGTEVTFEEPKEEEEIVQSNGENVAVEEEGEKESGINPWGAIFTSAMDHPDDHVPKVIRTLAYAATHFGHSGPGLYHSSLAGTETMDGSVFVRAAGLTLKTMGWVREGDESKSWDRSVLGFDSAWSTEPRLSSHTSNTSSSSNMKDLKGKKRSSTLTIEQEDEEILDAQAGDSSVVGGGINTASSRGGSEIDSGEKLSDTFSSGEKEKLISNGGIEVRRRIASEEEEAETRERMAREEAEEEERELMG